MPKRTKATKKVMESASADEPMREEQQPLELPPKRRRGRPPKAKDIESAQATQPAEESEEPQLKVAPSKRSKERPTGQAKKKKKKAESTELLQLEEQPLKEMPPKKPRGRPRNPNAIKRAKESASPKPRGRPKGSRNKPKTVEQLEELRSRRNGKLLSIDGKFLDLAIALGETSEPIMTFRRSVIRPFALKPEDRTQERVTFMFAKKGKTAT